MHPHYSLRTPRGHKRSLLMFTHAEALPRYKKEQGGAMQQRRQNTQQHMRSGCFSSPSVGISDKKKYRELKREFFSILQKFSWGGFRKVFSREKQASFHPCRLPGSVFLFQDSWHLPGISGPHQTVFCLTQGPGQTRPEWQAQL